MPINLEYQPLHETDQLKNTGVKRLRKPLIVCGNGPVLDKEKRIRAADANTTPGNEDVSFWSHDLAKAAAYLIATGIIQDVVVMGGKSGGPHYKPESQLVKTIMQECGVSSGNIMTEEESETTPDNIRNFLNLEQIPEDITVDLLALPSHVTRIKVLSQLFCLPVENTFTSSEVLTYAARAPEGKLLTDSTKWDIATLRRLEDVFDATDLKQFYQKQKGIETQSYQDKLIKDSLWTRELLQFPERWLKIAAGIKSDKRLQNIMAQAFAVYGNETMETLHITQTDTADLPSLREKLANLHYVKPQDEVDQWEKDARAGTPWPQYLQDRFTMLSANMDQHKKKI